MKQVLRAALIVLAVSGLARPDAAWGQGTSWTGPSQRCSIAYHATFQGYNDADYRVEQTLSVFIMDPDQDSQMNLQVQTTLFDQQTDTSPPRSIMIRPINGRHFGAINSRSVILGDSQRFWIFSEEESAGVVEALRSGVDMMVLIPSRNETVTVMIEAGNIRERLQAAFNCRTRQ